MKLLPILLAVVILQAHAAPIRAVWFAVEGTVAPFSPQGIENVVNKCKKIGINTIYFAVWDFSMINFYPEPSLREAYPFLNVNPRFIFDPLKYLIEVAHQNNIKVYAWFEFGFATTYGDPTGGPILKAKPDWKAYDISGRLVEKNNFQWMNGFHPQVQQFLSKMMISVSRSHDIDGVQGDDRLPAMPSTAGYDSYTMSLYKSQHGGQSPPSNYKDENWVSWRCLILDNFLKNFTATYRAQFPGKQIHMAPSVFSWSKYEYLQNWPTWINAGYIDAILPQVYRYDINAYKLTLQQNLAYVSASLRSRFFPGILVGVGSNTTENAKILNDSISINRALGITGESIFYHESIFDPRVEQILTSFYRQ